MFRRILLGAGLLIALMAAPAYGQYIPGATIPPTTSTTPGTTVTTTPGTTVTTTPPGTTVTTQPGGVAPVTTEPGGVSPATTEPGSGVQSNQGDQGFGQGAQGTQGALGAQGAQSNAGGGSSGPLPRTGSDLDRLGLIGAALLASGGLFLVATKRRRSIRGQVA